MKYFKFKIAIILLLVSVTISCDDYVDIEPQGLALPTSAKELDYILVNTNRLSLYTYSNLLSDDYDLPIDFQKDWNLNDDSFNTKLLVYQFHQEPSPAGNKDFSWDSMYEGIGQANFILQFIDQVDALESERKKIKAEALATRAYYYFYAVNSFGLPYTTTNATKEHSGVPIVNGKFGDTEQDLTRATLKEVYNLIITDLKEAVSLFDKNLPSDTFRMSKITAYTLLAKSYLNMGEYKLAGDYANEALKIKNNLLDFNVVLKEGEKFDFSCYCFLGNGKFVEPAPESNDEVFLRRGEDAAFSLATFFDQTTFQAVLGTILPTNLASIFDQTNDLRYARKTSSSSYGGRVMHQQQFFGGSFRVSELMLIKAEAEARVGSFTTAMNLINRLRAKRFKQSFVATNGHLLSATGATEALNHVLEEKRRELMYTDVRVQDIRRLNALEGANISVTHRLQDGTTKTIGPNDNLWTLAIPTDVVLRSNGQIQQNPR